MSKVKKEKEIIEEKKEPIILHLNTTVQTIFGVMDDNGNVLQLQPLVMNSQRLNSETILEILKAIESARDQIKEKLLSGETVKSG